MIVEDFIKWLQTQDQGATVEILVRERSVGYEGDSYSRKDFDPEQHGDYIDMRGNPYTAGKSCENSRILFLGED